MILTLTHFIVRINEEQFCDPKALPLNMLITACTEIPQLLNHNYLDYQCSFHYITEIRLPCKL